jgi:microcystin-dependent protein
LPTNPNDNRLGLSAPVGADPADVPVHIKAVTDRLAVIGAAYQQGSRAARDALTGFLGLFYRAKDEGITYVHDGDGWAPVVPLALSFPVAATLTWPWATEPVVDAPAEVRELNGQTIAKATYPQFFDRVGVTAASMVLPNWSGRVPLGAGQGPGLTDRPVGTTGGAETVGLTAAQNGPHAHGASTSAVGDHTHTGVALANDSQHTHPVSGQDAGVLVATGGLGEALVGGGSTGRWSVRLASLSASQDFSTHQHGSLQINPTGGHNHPVTINQAGEGQPHANMQPWVATRYFVRVR